MQRVKEIKFQCCNCGIRFEFADADTVFCPECGARLTSATQNAAARPQGIQTANAPKTGKPAKKGGGKMGILVAVLAVLLALVIGVFAFFILTNKDKNGSDPGKDGKSEASAYEEDAKKDGKSEAPAKKDGKNENNEASADETPEKKDGKQEDNENSTPFGFSDVQVGDTIKFGTYEQDNDTSNGKEEIEWRVLAVENGKALLISEYALDCQDYNTLYTDVTWESCSLRKWMNGTFLNNAFSAEEQAQIQNTTVSADKNPNYSTNPGNATTDKVFLLSITEVEKYFSSDNARQCKPTKYAVAKGAYVNSDNGNCWWWLRSPGTGQDSAAYVSNGGSVYYYGYIVNGGYNAVRPALWINLV